MYRVTFINDDYVIINDDKLRELKLTDQKFLIVNKVYYNINLIFKIEKIEE